LGSARPVVADAGYGDAADFRHALTERGLPGLETEGP
jgi:hypothetical protein